MDGLSIKNFEHRFVTRKLRYQTIHSGKTVYNQPITVRFNQPVELEKTAREVRLKNTTMDKEVNFIAEYGINRIYNNETKEYKETEDRSVILIFNKQDKHGRPKLWDFKNNYSLSIKSAYPPEGDIALKESREVNIQVTDIIQSISAESERTTFAGQKFFDPEGKLWVKFYEEVDLAKSDIQANKLLSFDYGKKCRDESDDLVISREVECEKTADRTRVFFVFDHTKTNYGEGLELSFNKIINISNQRINPSPIKEYIKVIPKLRLLRTIPNDNSKSTKLTELTLCTNSPLTPPAKEDIDAYLRFNLAYEFKRWNGSRLVPWNSERYKCFPGEFQTDIYYGLMPERDYKLNLKAIDHFSNEASALINFKTGKMPERFLNFYHLQKKYNVTTPDKTKLTYAVENMEYINMHICRLKPADMLGYLENSPHYTEPPSSIKNCQGAALYKITLEKKYWLKNYFQVDLKDYIDNPLGHYLLTFTHPDYKEGYGQHRRLHERTYLTVTNLAVVEKGISLGEIQSDEQRQRVKNLYWVTNLKN